MKLLALFVVPLLASLATLHLFTRAQTWTGISAGMTGITALVLLTMIWVAT